MRKGDGLRHARRSLAKRSRMRGGRSIFLRPPQTGQRLHMFNVIDDKTRECLKAVVDTSILKARMAREIARQIAWPGRLRPIALQQGTELASNALLARTQKAGIDWHSIAPHSHKWKLVWMYNGTNRCRTRSATRFRSLDHAREVVATRGCRRHPLKALSCPRIQHPRGLRHPDRRNGRSAARDGKALPIAILLT